jgi:uncharacterized integral membrane protein
MQKITSVLSGLFLILVFIVSIVFTYFNSTPVSIVFGSWQFAPTPVSVWIIGAFVSGAALGLLLGLRFFSGIKARSDIRRLSKQLKQVSAEASHLRATSFKDANKL